MTTAALAFIFRSTSILVSSIAIGEDVFPDSTLYDHVLRFRNIPQAFSFIWYNYEKLYINLKFSYSDHYFCMFIRTASRTTFYKKMCTWSLGNQHRCLYHLDIQRAVIDSEKQEGVNLRSAKVYEHGLLNYKAKHEFYPSEKKKFRCRYDYYQASVFELRNSRVSGSQKLWTNKKADVMEAENGSGGTMPDNVKSVFVTEIKDVLPALRRKEVAARPNRRKPTLLRIRWRGIHSNIRIGTTSDFWRGLPTKRLKHIKYNQEQQLQITAVSRLQVMGFRKAKSWLCQALLGICYEKTSASKRFALHGCDEKALEESLCDRVIVTPDGNITKPWTIKMF
ncbi:hypothetical protein CTI12_AA355650 [Artemisia annua]|uniref:Uncharacterized protein n=1 Tax=Artemisia annua TaxID=35608 RepID=A0A2U1MPA2_ARTAN|nr:hypothetical protein CTI12_AA355650 [Artemisia annua]